MGGAVEPWERLGLVAIDGTFPLFGTGIRIDDSPEPGLSGWGLSGLADGVPDIDGLATAAVAPATPRPRGASHRGHRTRPCRRQHRFAGTHVCAVTAATGAPLKRVRGVGALVRVPPARP